jgi:DNA topoisomerase I
VPKTNVIYRTGQPGKFTYRDSSGRTISNPDTLEYIRKLVIPPAWSDVEISANPGRKVLATGFDSAGRRQYIYNPVYRERREREKFDRLIAFANALPMMRQVTGRHLRQRKLTREKVLACMVRLIDQAYFRVGSERYAEENHTFGIATLRSRHLTIRGDKMIFEYRGKKGVEQHQEVRDEELSRVVSQLDHLPGYEIFKYYNEHGQLVDVKSGDLNAYIKEVMGYDFSAKDFRTWAGTLIAAVALSEVEANLPPSKAKRQVSAAVKHVAEHLGNTPAIARASYIDPRIIDLYLGGHTIKSYLSRVKQYLRQPDAEHFSPEELAVLKLLHRRLKSPSKSSST